MLRELRLAGAVLEEHPAEATIASLTSASSNLSLRWRKGRVLGSGASSNVYLAVDLDSGAVMAVKEIDFRRATAQAALDVQMLFKQELNVMEMLQRPNIVTFYGIEVHRDRVYIFSGRFFLSLQAFWVTSCRVLFWWKFGGCTSARSDRRGNCHLDIHSPGRFFGTSADSYTF
jgi:hypothetical protein